MPVIVACPSCGGQLRVADALRGQKVRCPACNHIFDSEAPTHLAPPDRPLDLDIDVPDIRRRAPRRDAEPDRGAIVLSLGIISLATVMVWCVAPLGAILGLVAWIMGQTDLRKMKSGQMDDQGRGMTQAGWICGILGLVLNGLMTLGCGVLVGCIWYSEMNRPPNTRPIPMMQPPPPPKGGFPPPRGR